MRFLGGVPVKPLARCCGFAYAFMPMVVARDWVVILGEHTLVIHRDGPPLPIGIDAGVRLSLDRKLRFDFMLSGAIDRVAIAPPRAGERTDGLWQHSCFEAFLRLPGGGYVEFNFSPSGDWASYRFDAYRTGMRADPAMPRLRVERSDEGLALAAEIDLAGWPALPDAIGLSAVIEEIDGTKSYWALRHPPGKPDFHHPDCFAIQLPAPEAS
jgi:hypothetical protein